MRIPTVFLLLGLVVGCTSPEVKLERLRAEELSARVELIRATQAVETHERLHRTLRCGSEAVERPPECAERSELYRVQREAQDRLDLAYAKTARFLR